MHVWRGLEKAKEILASARGTSVSIGAFDGLHIGHRQILQAMIGHAAASGLPHVVMTFDPHPLAVLRPDQPVPLLTDLDQKLQLLERLQVKHCLVLQFDHHFAAMSPSQFIDEVLVGTLQIRDIFVGYNFTFGRHGAGTPALLQEYGQRHGFQTHVFDAIRCNEQVISSTAIRHLISAGDLRTAAMYLGRPYRIAGPVVHGAARGRTIGFPTANVHLAPSLALPPLGVYAVRARVRGQTYGGAANLGVRPTVDGKQVCLEVHLLQFNGDLYGERLETEFIEFIRPEKKFANLKELEQQIQRDILAAEAIVR